MPVAHRKYVSLLQSSGIRKPYWDWNPTEGSGTVITDKQGSGMDLTTNAVWTPAGPRYDHAGVFNFLHASVYNDAFTMVQSSFFLYVKMPPVWTGGGYLGGHRPEATHAQDRKLIVNLPDGKLYAEITTAAGPNALVWTASTTLFTANDEFVAGYTHDGAMLRLWVNGVNESSVACGDSVSMVSPGFQVAGGTPPFSDREPPSAGGVLWIGRGGPRSVRCGQSGVFCCRSRYSVR